MMLFRCAILLKEHSGLQSVQSNFSLYPLNTFQVDAQAKSFLKVSDIDDIKEHLSLISASPERLVVGGGSNLLFIGDYPGLVIYPSLKGIEKLAESVETVTLRVAASENWHCFVKYCLANQYYGLENLALIPGTVGAAPIQNIGAYGVEVKTFVKNVIGFDLAKATTFELTKHECQFGYRDSLFKQAGQGRYLVTHVDFELSKVANLKLDYKPLKEAFSNVGKVTPEMLFNKVCEVRSQKLPDPEELANAGSFFKNPVIETAYFEKLKLKFPEIVGFHLKDHIGHTKVAAGWLIEQAGLKGMVDGKVGVHKHQALVLVNYADRNGANIWELAKKIISRVESMFGINLEPEVSILGRQDDGTAR